MAWFYQDRYQPANYTIDDLNYSEASVWLIQCVWYQKKQRIYVCLSTTLFQTITGRTNKINCHQVMLKMTQFLLLLADTCKPTDYTLINRC